MIDRRILYSIAEELTGQCIKDIEACCSERDIEFLDLTAEDLAVIDEIVFLCDLCGWWHEISKMCDDESADQQYCTDCGEGMGYNCHSC